MFDSHCHLTDERFADDLDAVLERAWVAGITGIVTVASGVDDARAAIAVARRDPRIRCSAGVHPHAAADADTAAIERIEDMLDDDDVVAIGETGLDFHYDNSPRSVQRALFERHLDLADRTGYPVIVHSRSADDETAALIRGAGSVAGVLHCFAGGRDLFDAGMEAGWYVSFAGLVTFRNFANADLVRAVPADRLLIETDSPYLAPVPHRGRRNEPAHVAATCAVVAALREQETAEVAHRTAANARRFYRLDAAAAAA